LPGVWLLPVSFPTPAVWPLLASSLPVCQVMSHGYSCWVPSGESGPTDQQTPCHSPLICSWFLWICSGWPGCHLLWYLYFLHPIVYHVTKVYSGVVHTTVDYKSILKPTVHPIPTNISTSSSSHPMTKSYTRPTTLIHIRSLQSSPDTQPHTGYIIKTHLAAHTKPEKHVQNSFVYTSQYI
jgi:hypothetical protein